MGEALLVDVVGWMGVIGLLVAYGLVSAKRVEGDSVVYQVLNVVGSGLLIVNSFYYGAYPSVAINVLWIGIGGCTLLRVWRERGGGSRASG